MIVIEDFLDAQPERAKALTAVYSGVEDGSGFVYPGFSETLDSESVSRIEELLGEKMPDSKVFYRYYSDEMNQVGYIHSDASVAKFTGILFLSEGREGYLDGLACWQHKRTKSVGFSEEIRAECEQLHQDGFDESLWHMTKFVPMRPGRLVIFPAYWWHSRYPELRPATALPEARLIKVFFCK